MRIIGEFDRDNVKVTVFSMNSRISVKFERDLMEQTYKFRDGSPVRTLKDVIRFCSPEIMAEIHQLFGKMYQVRGTGLRSMVEESENTFDFIL